MQIELQKNKNRNNTENNAILILIKKIFFMKAEILLFSYPLKSFFQYYLNLIEIQEYQFSNLRYKRQYVLYVQEVVTQFI